MRVVFLTHYYPPERGAPQTRIAELAGRLAARGLDVTVHTGFPRYPTGTIEAPYRNRPLRRERLDGVPVVRSAVFATPNSSSARRLLDHAAFSASALALAAATGPADVVVAESPPLFLAGAAVAYARAKRAPLVLHVSDLWPASVVALGAVRDPRAVRLGERLERWAYANAAAIAAPTAGIAAVLEAEPAAAGRVARLGPAVDLARFPADPPRDGAGPLEVVYAGTVGLAQGLGTLVEAAAIAGSDAVRVTIAGAGADWELIRERAARGAGAVRVLGSLPAAEVPALYARADAGTVLLRDLPLFEGALPTKLLEAMAAGRAVVLAGRGEAAELLRRTGAGVVVEPERPDALAAAFRALAADRERLRALGAAGRAAAEAEFGRDASAAAWAALLERVVSAGPRRARRRRRRRRPRSSRGAAGG